MDYGNIAQLMLNGKEDTKVNDTGVEIKNNIKILYHGSCDRDLIPDINKCKSDNDYGPGFYTTEIQDLAKEWATYRGSYGHCYINKYEFDDTGLNVFKFNDKDFLQWLAVLLNYREVREIKNMNNPNREALLKILHDYKFVDMSKYDCAEGWRADDAYYSFVTEYVFGDLSTEHFIQSIKNGDIGLQYVLLSPKAFDRIKFIESTYVNYSIWDRKSMERHEKACQAHNLFLELSKADPFARRFFNEIEDLVKKG